MAAPKGHPQYGGRKRGVPNRKTQELADKCRELGVDPFHIQLLFAKGDYEALGYSEYQTVGWADNGEEIKEITVSPELRQKSAAEICQYLYPKRKAVEHSATVSDEVLEKLEELKALSDTELKKIVKNG